MCNKTHNIRMCTSMSRMLFNEIYAIQLEESNAHSLRHLCSCVMIFSFLLFVIFISFSFCFNLGCVRMVAPRVIQSNRIKLLHTHVWRQQQTVIAIYIYVCVCVFFENVINILSEGTNLYVLVSDFIHAGHHMRNYRRSRHYGDTFIFGLSCWYFGQITEYNMHIFTTVRSSEINLIPLVMCRRR